MAQPYVMSLLFVLGLLLVGFVLRAGVKPLRLLFVPASVIGGLLGLAFMQAGLRIGPTDVVRVDGDLRVNDDSLGKAIGEDGEVEYYEPLVNLGEFLSALDPDSTYVKGPVTQYWSANISNVIDGWPGLLIAVVFAGLLMERPGKRFGEAAKRAGRQGLFVWIIGIGEAFVGLLAFALLIAPFFDGLPPVLGQLIETGFIGGHGTAAAMGEVMDEQFGFPAGRDLAFLFATVGLVYGVLSGIVFVNLGIRRGWLRGGPSPEGRREEGGGRKGPDAEARASGPNVEHAPDATDAEAKASGSGSVLEYRSNEPNPVERGNFTVPVVSGLEDRADPPPSTFARVRSETIDPLAFQLCLLGVAFAIGYALQQGFLWLAGLTFPADWVGYVDNVPLFLFTLLGGWLLREAMHLLGVGDLIDAPSINRLTGIAMELLIVAALATLRIDALGDYLGPVVILLLAGFAWTAFCLLFLARRVLPRDYWFELGLMNYGMSTATTAQGILLLRIVDRDLDTGAAEDYAAAAPLSAPFIGGGVLTVLAVPLALLTVGIWPVLAAMGAVLAALIVASLFIARGEGARA